MDTVPRFNEDYQDTKSTYSKARSVLSRKSKQSVALSTNMKKSQVHEKDKSVASHKTHQKFDKQKILEALDKLTDKDYEKVG